jgi:antitoxin component YwqK of YwqJK toxin-antitoxin module
MKNQTKSEVITLTQHVYYYENGNIRDFVCFNRNYCIHNDMGPASIHYYEDGNIKEKEYWNDDKLHNENGPASIHYYEDGKIKQEEYFVNDMLSNKEGPAVVYYNKSGQPFEEQYWIEGVEYTKEQFENFNKPQEEKVVEIEGKKYKLVEI